jgi:hypothetical protein
MDLNYEIRERAPTQLRLDSDGQRQILTFPLTPPWMVLVSIGASLAIVVAQVMFFALLFWISRHLPMHYEGWLIAIALPIIGFHVFNDWRNLRSYRRYGHLPRAVWVDPVSQILGHRMERTNRQTEWPLAAISHVGIKTIRNLTRRPICSSVKIRLRGRIFPLFIQCRIRDQATLDSFLETLVPLLPAEKIHWVGNKTKEL